MGFRNPAALEFHMISSCKRIVAMVLMPLLITFLDTASHEAAAQNYSPGKKSFINTLGMQFIFIPSGTFTMGSRLQPSEIETRYGGDAKWYDDECPQHEVTLTKSFYIQTTEVTQSQWFTVMGVNPSGFKNCGGDCPVEKVSWYDTQEFINRLNQKEETDKYRLPTEAEWEYACRAGSTAVFCFGNEIKELGVYAWYNHESREWTHKVNIKKPNAWGLYDMHGNVWEWCQDWYNKYTSGPVTDPIGPPSGTHRVSKGGSWRSAARFCRSAHRYGVDPGYRRPTRGFRLVKEP